LPAVSVSVGSCRSSSILLGCGALLAWPLRALSASVLFGVDALAATNVTATNATAAAGAAAVGAGPLLLQPAWDFAAKDYGHITSSPAFPGALSISYFFSSCLPYMALDMLPAWLPGVGTLKAYKVQQDKPVRCSLTFRSLFAHFLTSLLTQVEWKDIWKSFRETTTAPFPCDV